MAPPSSCTRSVRSRCRIACRRVDISAANGFSQPRRVGEYPPVIISPTPPRARSAKYSVSFGRSHGWSSRPVCIDPITSRLRNVRSPRVIGSSRCGYGEGLDTSASAAERGPGGNPK